MLFDILATAVLFAVLTLILQRWKSRFAAVTLLLLSLLMAVAGAPTAHGGASFVGIVAAYGSIRAIQATFKLRGQFSDRRKNYDVKKWEALVKYDPDIAKACAKLQPLGQKWIDELAQAYLAINDKRYLVSIVLKIIADAREEHARGSGAAA